MRTVLGSLTVFSLILCGCGGGDDIRRANEYADRFYDVVETGEIEAILGMYAAEFFDETPQSYWQDALTDLYARTGRYKSHSVINTQIKKTLRTGTTIDLSFRVEYEKAVTYERLTLKGSENPKLVFHQIVPEEEVAVNDMNFNQIDTVLN